jgi:hypothetical protein
VSLREALPTEPIPNLYGRFWVSAEKI